MKFLLVIYWTILGFVKKHTLLLLFSIVLGILAMLFIPKVLPLLPKKIYEERVALIGKPTLSEIPLFIQNQVSLGLTKNLPNGEATASAAKEFHVEENGKRFVFTLRDDLYWTDGKQLTSEDVNYNFRDAEIERPDKNVVVFNLKEPFSPFPSVVSQPLFRQSISRFKGAKTTIYG